MALTVCWAAKGGSGTSVTVAAMALVAGPDTLLIDLAGDLPDVLGLPAGAGPGIGDWFGSDAPPAAVDDLAVAVSDDVRLVPAGVGPIGVSDERSARRWVELAEHLAARTGTVLVDGATSPPPQLLASAHRSLLVTRLCYVALARAARATMRPSGVIALVEAGRVIQPRDVTATLRVPLVATIHVDPAVAQLVDLGLLATNVPRHLRRSLKDAA